MTATIAITGGTGFVGTHVIQQARAQGLAVRALTRRAQPAQPGVTWIEGALDRPASLAALSDRADAMLHIAGMINAPDRAGFEACNVTGTADVIAAAREAGIRRFVHVSSLAAREPSLSDYGWSKARSEDVVRASGLDWTIVRPPAVYGPHDREMLELFRVARWRFIPLPPDGRLSVIAGEDLARLLLVLGQTPAGIGALYEPDDGVSAGWDHREFARAIGLAVGRRILPLSIPEALLMLGARADRLARGGAAKLTPDRVRYFCHPDWVVSAAARPPGDMWAPAVATPDGLRATANWYRAAGLLK
ncbi:NAD-dependent epimerase/dehydratase family protein [Flavisphingomonas formosensis]|uniref:NAD-dependent epimerase/dehydratase family protein n=1 Tax=Flavisphingomonas formosensis TaxID=861534 RepID=UPI0012F93630|nr:NAD(P)H-binding protein [Sphingomonas formosensis]